MAVEPTESLKDHEAQFHPGRSARQPQAEAAEPKPAPVAKAEPSVTDDPDLGNEAKEQALHDESVAREPGLAFVEPKPRLERHRATSQQATAKDFETIKTLSATLKERSEALAKLRTTDAADSPRVLALKQRIRGIEADLDSLKPAPKVEVKAPVSEVTKPATPSAFTEKEPDYKDFEGKSADPYSDWLLAKAEWRASKRAFELEQTRRVEHEKSEKDRAAKETEDTRRATVSAYQSRSNAFAATHPDYFPKIAEMQAKGHDIPPVVTAAIMESDNGPELLYSLLGHPDELDRLLLANLQTPVTASTVVAMRRYLTALSPRTAAGTTGAAPATVEHRAPRPPTPVRTGPLKTGDEPPDDGASLASHEAYFGRRRR